jgi:hypothetical protein
VTARDGIAAESANAPTCAMCNEPVGEFRDGNSRREFRISGMCQVCQDDFFCDLGKPGVTECHKPCCEDESRAQLALETARLIDRLITVSVVEAVQERETLLNEAAEALSWAREALGLHGPCEHNNCRDCQAANAKVRAVLAKIEGSR